MRKYFQNNDHWFCNNDKNVDMVGYENAVIIIGIGKYVYKMFN